MSRSIENMRVLVTRPQPQAEKLCKQIETGGGIAIHLPVLAIEALQDKSGILRKLQAMTDFKMGIFTSQNAAIHTLEILGGHLSLLQDMNLVAIGRSTAGILQQAGIDKVIYPQRLSSSEILLQLGIMQPENIKGIKIIIFRGQGGRDLLARQLQDRGAYVEYLEVYRRTPVHYDKSVLDEICFRQKPDSIVITSGEGLHKLFDMLSSEQREFMLNLPMIVLSERVAGMAVALGVRNKPLVAEDTSDQGILSAVQSLYRQASDG